MWKKILWSEVKQGQNVFDCNANYPDEHPCSTLIAAKGEPKTKTHLLDGQTACCSGDHIYCVAWVEEVTLPRVVVEWTEKAITYRLVQTTESKLAVECLAYKEDLMGLKHLYWDFWTNPASGMGSGLIAALVEKLDSVGQK